MESSALISSLDVYTTILDAAGIQRPDELGLDGKSFLSIIQDEENQGRDFVFAGNGYTRSVTDGRYKYIALSYSDQFIEAMEKNEIDHAPSYVGNWPQAHSAIAMKGFSSYFDQNQF